MNDQVRTLTIRQILDAGGYVSGGQSVEAANRGMSDSARATAAEMRQVQVELTNAANPVGRLTRAYDQAGAAQQKFASDLTGLNAALERGKVSAEGAAAIYAGMVSRLGLMADSTHLAGQGFAQMGRIVEETNRAIMQQATAARATAQAARETELYAQKASALRAMIDPIGASQARMNAEIAEYSVLLNRAEISTSEFARAQQLARQRHDEFVTSLNRMPANDTPGLSSEAQYRRQNLGMQLFDVGQSVSLGMNPAMILAQQGPQIAQIYAMQGGLNAAMRDFSVILGGVARVAGPLIGILAGVYGAYKILESNSVAAGLAVSDATRALAAQAAPIGSLQGQMDELTRIQATYNRALSEGAFASSTATALILANSKREYEARKALLELELLLQDAKLKTQQADIALAGQAMKERVSQQVVTDPSRAVRDGFADPRINGGIPFVRLTDDISGLQKTMDALDTDPSSREIAKLRAEMTLTKIGADALREAVKKPFETDPAPTSVANQASRGPLINDPDYLDWLAGKKPISGAVTPPPAQQPKIGAVTDREAGARTNLVEQTQARAQLLATQADEIDKLRLEAQLVGASERERVSMTAALQAEQQLRQQGINLLSAEGQAYKNNAVMMAQARLEIERQNAAFTSLQQSGGSAIDALTVGTGSLKDRLKAAADTMLQWIQQLAIANPLKNQLFGTNLPTLSDLFAGKPMMPGATSTASMMVTAGTVMVNGGVMGGQFPSIPGTTLPGTTTGGGLLDVLKPAAANVNGVRPDLTAAGIVNSPVAAAANPVPGSDVQSQVWNYWAAKGLPPHQIAGIMGNIQAESAFRPGVDTGDGGNAWGLAQWNDRRNAMVNYVGPDWRTDVKGQMDFMNHEFQTTEASSWARLRSSTDVRSATAAMAGYERPSGYSVANPEGSHNWSGRLDAANANLTKFSSTTATATKDVGSFSDSAVKAGSSLTDSLGKLSTSVPAVSTPAVAPAATTASGGGIFSSLFGGIFKLFGFADGTDFSPGGWAMVGERGPELVNLPRGSQVVPNHKLVTGPNSEERMRMGPRAMKVDVGVSVDRNGNLEAWVRNISEQTSESYTRTGFAAYDASLPDRLEDIQRNPHNRAA